MSSGLFGSYGENRPARGEPIIQIHYGENKPQQYNIDTGKWQTPSDYLGAEKDSYIPFAYPLYRHHILDVGILRDTLLPSVALHSTLSVAAWGLGRHFDRADAKDFLWPGAMIANTWWSAIGRRLIVNRTPLSTVLRTISWPERLIIAGVSVWGGSMLYTKASKSSEDDPKYAVAKKQDGFWNDRYIPEALIQTLITLPMVAPFRHQGAVMSGYHPFVQSVSVGIFSAGLALRFLADSELESHKQSTVGEEKILKSGVWSIVRHPNNDMLAPVELLGPLASYLYLRYIGGDAEQELLLQANYEKTDPEKAAELKSYQTEKNFIWPKIQEFNNPAVLTVLGAGVAGAVVERALRYLLH